MVGEFRLNQTHDAILTKGFYQFHFLTPELLLRLLLYSPGSLNTMKKHLKQLEDAKYLSHTVIPTKVGKRPYVYALGARGKEYLEAKGLEVQVYYKPAQVDVLGGEFLYHVLELNKFLIEALRLEYVAPLRPHIDFHHTQGMIEQQLPAVFLHHMDHDLLLQAQPFETKTWKDEPVKVKPDAILEFRIRLPHKTQKHRKLFLIEFDRNTERDKIITAKIEGFFALADNEVIQQRYGGAWDYVWCFVTTGSSDRLEAIRSLGRTVITNTYLEEEHSKRNQMLYFSTFPSLQEAFVNAEVLFLTPYFLHAFGSKSDRVPLLHLSKSEG